MPSLYPSLLGASWQGLGPGVRRLHEGAVSARGIFRVRRGVGFLARWLGSLLGMPRAGEAVAVRLSVSSTRAGHLCTRAFAESPLCTLQWQRGPFLVEALGLVQCVFRLRAEGGTLVFHQVGAVLGRGGFGLPLPSFLRPRIEGRAQDRDDQVHVDVRIHAPLLGLLVAYDGLVTPRRAEDDG